MTKGLLTVSFAVVEAVLLRLEVVAVAAAAAVDKLSTEAVAGVVIPALQVRPAVPGHGWHSAHLCQQVEQWNRVKVLHLCQQAEQRKRVNVCISLSTGRTMNQQAEP